MNPLPTAYNNLLDPHLKAYFSKPSRRRLLVKRGFITKEGDVVCHTLKDLTQYRNYLYTNHQEMMRTLRADIDAYLPQILAKRRAIAVSVVPQNILQDTVMWPVV